jgi:hypothetical protein
MNLIGFGPLAREGWAARSAACGPPGIGTTTVVSDGE